MILAALLALLLQGPTPSKEVAPVLGVLETPQVEGAPPVMARLLFHRVQGRWKPISTREAWAAPSIGWAVGFQGRSLGAFELAPSKTPSDGVREGLLRALMNPDQAPRLPAPAGTFDGWMRAADRRPLVIQQGRTAPDPDGWSPQEPSPKLKAKLWPALRKAWGSWRPVHCPQDPEQAEPFRVHAGDLQISQGFRSRDGRWVVALGIDPERYRCDGIVDAEWAPHWFLIEQGRVRFLGRELAWVDAGDFGGTGRSDILFAHAGYNQDGYVLLSQGLRRRAEVRWSYH